MALLESLRIAVQLFKSNSILIHFVGLLLLFGYQIPAYAQLRHVPGRFLASCTNLVRLRWVWSRRAHEIHIELHENHGPLVRIGPNVVSVADPAIWFHGYLHQDWTSIPYYNHLQKAKGAKMPGLLKRQTKIFTGS